MTMESTPVIKSPAVQDTGTTLMGHARNESMRNHVVPDDGHVDSIHHDSIGTSYATNGDLIMYNDSIVSDEDNHRPISDASTFSLVDATHSRTNGRKRGNRGRHSHRNRSDTRSHQLRSKTENGTDAVKENAGNRRHVRKDDWTDHLFPILRSDVRRKDWITVTLVIFGWVCYMIAAGMASYAVFSVIQNENIQRSVAKGVVNDVKAWPGADVKADYEKAKKYNDSLGDMTQRVVGDVIGEDGKPIEESDRKYMDTLNINKSGAMAVLSIPKISAEMTIWHTTGESVLEKGVGHVYGTAMPIGQKGTMSAIAAHSGGVNGLFFTRLHQMKLGDYFYIDVLGKQMGYQVDSIKVVDPEDVGDAILHTKPNEARVTMITCTPIGVNTQRLLVSGIRKSMPQPIPEAYTQKDNTLIAARAAAIVFIVLVLIGTIGRHLYERRSARRLERKRRESTAADSSNRANGVNNVSNASDVKDNAVHNGAGSNPIGRTASAYNEVPILNQMDSYQQQAGNQ